MIERGLRYFQQSGLAMVVRPTGVPNGTRVFDLQWDPAEKSIAVWNPAAGNMVMMLPGKWRGNQCVGEASSARQCVSGVSPS